MFPGSFFVKKACSHNTSFGKIILAPSSVRITLKIALITYKTFVNKETGLSLGVAIIPNFTWTLWSSSTNRFHVDIPRTVFAGRAFCFTAPHTWNSLRTTTDFSLSLNNFKHHLKTYLFNLAYHHWQSSCPGLRFSFFIIFLCFHWHMTHYLLGIIIIIL